MFFQTERLLVRELTKDDIPLFVEMQSNANVMKYIASRPKTKDESIDELEKIIDSYKNINREFLVLAVAKKEDNKFVGTCAIMKNYDEEHEIGYRFLEGCWGNGYGKETIDGLIKFSFQSLNLEQIVAHVNKDNYSSVKILESSNFVFIREYVENETGDLVLYYKMLKPDYKE